MPSSTDTPLPLRSSAANGPTEILAITVATCWQKSKSCFGCVRVWNLLCLLRLCVLALLALFLCWQVGRVMAHFGDVCYDDPLPPGLLNAVRRNCPPGINVLDVDYEFMMEDNAELLNRPGSIFRDPRLPSEPAPTLLPAPAPLHAPAPPLVPDQRQLMLAQFQLAHGPPLPPHGQPTARPPPRPLLPPHGQPANPPPPLRPHGQPAVLPPLPPQTLQPHGQSANLPPPFRPHGQPAVLPPPPRPLQPHGQPANPPPHLRPHGQPAVLPPPPPRPLQPHR